MASQYGRRPASSNAPERRRSTNLPHNRTSASRERVAPGVSSVRIGDVQGARTARMQSRYNRYVRRVITVLGALVAIVVLYALLYFAGAFPVTQVTVNGCEHLTNEQVAEAAAVPADSTLLRVDEAGIVARLESQAWVESASVSRIPPGTLQLNIRERSIKAVVQVPSHDGADLDDWAISSDGIWLMLIPDRDSAEAAKVNPNVYADADEVLHIVQVPYGVEPVVGERCTDANVNNALDIISGLSDELSSQVVSVAATGAETATLMLGNGVEIAFGDADDVRDKERISLQLMQEYEGQIAYINVRTPSKPTWRSV